MLLIWLVAGWLASIALLLCSGAHLISAYQSRLTRHKHKYVICFVIIQSFNLLKCNHCVVWWKCSTEMMKRKKSGHWASMLRFECYVHLNLHCSYFTADAESFCDCRVINNARLTKEAKPKLFTQTRKKKKKKKTKCSQHFGRKYISCIVQKHKTEMNIPV